MTRSVPALHLLAMTGVRAAILLLAQGLCLPFAAGAITISFSGVVDGLIDSADRLDGSVAIGTPVSGFYSVDATPSGGDPAQVGAAQLVFAFGSYLFDQTQDPHRIELLDDTGPPIAPVDIWQTDEIVIGELGPAIPPPPDLLGYAAGLQLFDFTASRLDAGDTTPFVPGDLSGWSSGRLALNSLVDDLTGGAAIGDLQMTVALESWSAVPEPRAGILIGLGLVAVAGRRR